MITGCFGVLAESNLSADEEKTPTEDEIKAAFLLNFPKYVEWPISAFADTNSPIVFIVIADKGVARELRRMADNKLFNNRPLEVKVADAENPIPSDCHILFLGSEEDCKAAQIIPSLGDRAILTVGECADFFDDGGVIKLVRRDRKIRLEVNLAGFATAQLKISSKLLGVADVVRRKERE